MNIKIFKIMCIYCVLAGYLFAENELILENIFTQDEAIKESANWQSEDIKNHAGSRSIISNQQLNKTGKNSLDTALQSTPSIQIRDYSGIGILPKLQFRGFGGAGNGHSNTGMILLDGFNVYGAPYSNIELALFPATFQMIDHIDIIRGGMSVQYGPNTFSGVLNFIGKEIPKEWENQIAQRITFWGKDTQNTTNVRNNMLYDTYLRSGGMINSSFGIQMQANIIGGESFRENSKSDIRNFTLDGLYKINANHNIKAFLQYYDYLANDPGSLSIEAYNTNRFANLRPYNLASGSAKRLGISYISYFGDSEKLNGNFEAKYYFHDVTRDFRIDDLYNSVDFSKKPTKTTDNIRNFLVNSLEVKTSLFNKISPIFTQNILVGMRYLREDILSSSYTTALSTQTITQNPSSFYHNNFLAFYIGDEIKLWDKIVVNPGLRYEFLDYTQTDKVEHRYANKFNPAISISYTPISSVILYSNYQKSFLPPQMGDITGTNFNSITTFQNMEFGGKYLWKNYLSVGLNYFAIFADDYRIGKFSTDSGISALSQGIEFEIFAQILKNLDLHFAYAFNDARVSNHKINNGIDIYHKFLPYVSPHHLSFDVTYQISKVGTFGISGFYYTKSYSDILNTVDEDSSGKVGVLPAYFVFNMQFSKTLWQYQKQKIDASFSINNLFNEKYYFRGIGTSPIGRQPAAGRSVSFYISYLF